mmetsp:Transcript_27660/g.59635  ORF Transcript_27660/g.59635 Transcript_27660/m.59635 type:complete len:224 (+) Transcript_27660:870-1541(+)
MLCCPPSPCLYRRTILRIISPTRLFARAPRRTSLSHHMCLRKGIIAWLAPCLTASSVSCRYARPLMLPSFSVPSSVNSMLYAPLDSVRRKNCSTMLLQSTVPPLAAVCRNFSNCSPSTTFTWGHVRVRLEVENAGAMALRALSRSVFAVIWVSILSTVGSTGLAILAISAAFSASAMPFSPHSTPLARTMSVVRMKQFHTGIANMTVLPFSEAPRDFGSTPCR